MNTNEVKAKEKKIPDLKSSLQLIYGQREITRRSSRVRVKRDAKVWRHKKFNLWNYGIFTTFGAINIREPYLPKTSIMGQIVSEILAQLCSDDFIQTLLKFDLGLNVL